MTSMCPFAWPALGRTRTPAEAVATTLALYPNLTSDHLLLGAETWGHMAALATTAEEAAAWRRAVALLAFLAPMYAAGGTVPALPTAPTSREARAAAAAKALAEALDLRAADIMAHRATEPVGSPMWHALDHLLEAADTRAGAAR